MFIGIRELALRKIEFNEELAPGVIDLGPDLRQQGGLKTQGRAELLKEHRGGKNTVEDIRLVGDFAGTVEVRCARCLEPVTLELANEFDLLYRPLGVDARADEVSISEAETEIGYYQGEGILLEDAIKEQVLLTAPVKTICRNDCKGLCPHCGKNRNQETCDCAESVPDPRWAALEEIKKNLKKD